MNKQNKQFSFVNIGLSSLLVIFLVLCLTTFALLSLSGAKSDYSQSRKLAEHRSDYYAAASEAEKIIADIDEELAASSGKYTGNAAKYNGNAIKYNGDNEISFSVPMNDRQSLDVTLRLTDTSSADSYYEITKWQITNTSEHNIDDTVQLLPIK